MSEADINIIIIVGFIAITAACIAYAYFRGKNVARSFGASDEELDKAFDKAKSKLGLIVGIFFIVAIIIFAAAWVYLGYFAVGIDQ